MVVGDSVQNLSRFTETPRQVRADFGVGAFDLAVDGFADVVEQSGAARQPLVDTDFSGDNAGQVRDLNGVFKDVLTVRGAKVHPAQKLKHPRLEPDHVGL